MSGREIHSPGDGNHAPPGVFEKMAHVEAQLALIEGGNLVSPQHDDALLFLVGRIRAVLATIKDARVTYGIIIDPDELDGCTPMMVERDAIVEALYGA